MLLRTVACAALCGTYFFGTSTSTLSHFSHAVHSKIDSRNDAALALDASGVMRTPVERDRGHSLCVRGLAPEEAVIIYDLASSEFVPAVPSDAAAKYLINRLCSTSKKVLQLLRTASRMDNSSKSPS